MSTSSLIVQYYIIPGIILLAILIAWGMYSNYKSGRVVAARGGIKVIYKDLFDAIKQMPYHRINYLSNTHAIAIYTTDSGKTCKIDITLSAKSTYVEFSISYNGKWTTIGKKQYDGIYSGSDILLRIILTFPDCNLSY